MRSARTSFDKPGPVLDARETLARCGIERGADFHTLPRDKVDAIIAAADRAKYRKPPTAKGSRARYFHDRLQRLARGVIEQDARDHMKGITK